MVRGADLRRGDMVYFSQTANPRLLGREVQQGTWNCVTVAVSFGFEKRFRGTCTIDANRWYVVKRRQTQ